MPASNTDNLPAMSALQKKIHKILKNADFTQISPAILQPANAYLDQIGEIIRSRSYVFTDMDGEELCLRPDLTVPASRVYIAAHPDAIERERFFYTGPVFRSPCGELEAQKSNPREFFQAGFEVYGKDDEERTETEVLRLTLNILSEIGVDKYLLRIGDLGLFHALLDAIDMPERWRVRLKENFWRHDFFHKTLHELGQTPDLPEDVSFKKLVRGLASQNKKEREARVADYLDQKSIPLIGARSLEEITAVLTDKALDLDTEPLSSDKIDLIERYLQISAPPKAVGARLLDMAETAGLDLNEALNLYQQRIEIMADSEIDFSQAEFTSEFGRNLEYYTGFVFQIELADMGQDGQIAGGGRYDHLIKNLGGKRSVPAVGAALHLDRLLPLIDGSFE